jgi:hypothetical protein
MKRLIPLALLAACATASAGKPDRNGVSRTRIEEAPSVVLEYSFAYDRGNVLEAIVIDGKRFKTTDDDPLPLSERVLAKMGWKKASPDRRKQLVLSWLRQGVYGGGRSLVQEPTTPTGKLRDGKDQPFTGSLTAPSVKAVGDKLIVDLWSSGASSPPMCDPRYGLVEYAHHHFEVSATGRVVHDDANVDVVYEPCPGYPDWEE